MVKKEIKELILSLCEGKDWDWKGHVESVVKHSKNLSKEYGADKEVCEIAAWLHDIDKIKGGKEGHHIRGAKEAEIILKKLDYPDDKIKKVCYCILTHSSDNTYPPKTLEAKIVASADSLAHFDNFLSIMQFCFKKEYGIDKIKEKILKKANQSYDKMMPKVKKLAKPKYDAIKEILK